jgi:hypothetical protein
LWLASVSATLLSGATPEQVPGLRLQWPIHSGSMCPKGFSLLRRIEDSSYGVYVLCCPTQRAVQTLWSKLPFHSSLALA